MKADLVFSYQPRNITDETIGQSIRQVMFYV